MYNTQVEYSCVIELVVCKYVSLFRRAQETIGVKWEIRNQMKWPFREFLMLQKIAHVSAGGSFLKYSKVIEVLSLKKYQK